jgi:hypothetical protein
MKTRPSLYRSTLIAAAVAIGCFGAAAAQARDHDWRGHGEERAWHGRDHGWRDHDGDRGWTRYRGYAPRYGYVAPAWTAGYVEYAAPVAYYPAPPVAYAPGGVSVVVRLPF